ncbi:hypothetical protein J6590_035395 [Homalodisca vitripennis]|nr:hypothetical protein J6590_035395 [Homalodisca vitripennis]
MPYKGRLTERQQRCAVKVVVKKLHLSSVKLPYPAGPRAGLKVAVQLLASLHNLQNISALRNSLYHPVNMWSSGPGAVGRNVGRVFVCGLAYNYPARGVGRSPERDIVELKMRSDVLCNPSRPRLAGVHRFTCGLTVWF